MGYLRSILDSSFMPRGHCFFWTTDIFWLHLTGDLVTVTATAIASIGTAINGFTSLSLIKRPKQNPVRENLIEVAKAGERAFGCSRMQRHPA